MELLSIAPPYPEPTSLNPPNPMPSEPPSAWFPVNVLFIRSSDPSLWIAPPLPKSTYPRLPVQPLPPIAELLVNALSFTVRLPSLWIAPPSDSPSNVPVEVFLAPETPIDWFAVKADPVTVADDVISMKMAPPPLPPPALLPSTTLPTT